MSKKKNKSIRAGTYAMCITIGVIIGVGLAPIANNLTVTLVLGTAGGVLAGYLFDRQNMAREKRQHHH